METDIVLTRHTPDQILAKLRDADGMFARGNTVLPRDDAGVEGSCAVSNLTTCG